MNPEHPETAPQSRSDRFQRREPTLLPAEAEPVALQALREARLRGLPVAEEYRVISERLYRSGVRDLPPGALVRWIEETISTNYEAFLQLRALGDQINAAIARDDLAGAAWELICRLPAESRVRLIVGARRLDELEVVE